MTRVIDWIHHEELVLLLHNMGSEECIWRLEDSQGTSCTVKTERRVKGQLRQLQPDKGKATKG